MLVNLGTGAVAESVAVAFSGASDEVTLACPVAGEFLNATATGIVTVSVTLGSA